MNIVSLEDDEPFWDLLNETLESEFRDIHLHWIHTESQFIEQIPDFIKNPPDLFLLDVMVKWADASAEMPTPPKAVEAGKYFRAGIRCRMRLLDHPKTKFIPVVLFTVLEQEDMEQVVKNLPENTWVTAKTGDFQKLIAIIKEFGGVPMPPSSTQKLSS
jgi:hypothetical protein